MIKPPIPHCLVLSPGDNVGVIINAMGEKGKTIAIKGGFRGNLVLRKDIPAGHKVALNKIGKNSPVIKGGESIGLAKKTISPGEHVHIHNVTCEGAIKCARSKARTGTAKNPRLAGRSYSRFFKGFIRKDGRAGTRNYIVVLSSVNCSASVAEGIAAHFRKKDTSGKGIDAVIPVTHDYGCAQPAGSAETEVLKKTLSGWLDHPNVVAAICVGLGCEVLSPSLITGKLRKTSHNKKFLNNFSVQDARGMRKSISLGVDMVKRIIKELPLFKRRKLPVSLLTLALNCGGSDGFSILTANPALGVASDILIRNGGTSVLAEIPECYGAESMLLKRCTSLNDRNRLKRIFSRWDNRIKKGNLSMNDNISSGNVSGGLSNILEKSLGAVSKCGTSKISQVVECAERVTKKGLVVMDTPGYDPMSITALAAGGCNLVAFTTGRGSIYNCPIAPTVKIASNSGIYRRLKDDIDLDAGKILSGNTVEESGREIYEFLVRVASGTRTKGEAYETKGAFVPWYRGEVL
ncbi:MAG: altronate dehydratase [Candidatus Omnitrophica bacterium]|nr:altronate dehydratase [Candidatus Omnitrophota bacterium]